jgi:hypothetical protein
MNTLIMGMITLAYDALIRGDKEEAHAYMDRARELWNAYMTRIKGNQRIQLDPLDMLRDTVLKDLLTRLPPEAKATLYAEEPRAAQLIPPNVPPQK